MRDAFFATARELIIIILGLPPLAGVAFLFFTYLWTVCVQPNALGPFDWYTFAWLQGLVAALLGLLASPLVGSIVEFAAGDANLPLHINASIPHLAISDAAWSSVPCTACNGQWLVVVVLLVVIVATAQSSGSARVPAFAPRWRGV